MIHLKVKELFVDNENDAKELAKILIKFYPKALAEALFETKNKEFKRIVNQKQTDTPYF